MGTLNLTKHHALGNDFLVVFDVHGIDDLPALARRLCDRRTGVGADGLLIGESADGYAAKMVLFNADGSRAEMSGNGIRCFAHAVADRIGSTAPVRILTDAGERHVELAVGRQRGSIVAAVSMGEVTDLPEPDGWSVLGVDPMRPVLHVSLGNPHAVVGVDDVRVVDLLALGEMVPHVNLEIVEPGPGPNEITMRVHERGAGITQACGTGACASAYAAAQWGLVPSAATEIVVHMDGGDATVRLHHPRHGHVTLVGPAVKVASLTVDVDTE